jgi:hypothetical protein
VIVAADHMRYPHVVIVDHHREHVGGGPVGAQQDIVVDLGILHRDLALDLVVDCGFALGRDLEADHIGRAFGRFACVAIAPPAVVAHRLLVGALLGAHCLEFFGRGEAFVGVSRVEQLVRDLGVAFGAVGLEDRRFVEIEAEPVEPLDDLVDRILRAALAIGILDPQQGATTMVPCVKPVEQRRTRAADMEISGGRGSEAGDDRRGLAATIACHCHSLPFKHLHGDAGDAFGTDGGGGRRGPPRSAAPLAHARSLVQFRRAIRSISGRRAIRPWSVAGGRVRRGHRAVVLSWRAMAMAGDNRRRGSRCGHGLRAVARKRRTRLFDARNRVGPDRPGARHVAGMGALGDGGGGAARLSALRTDRRANSRTRGATGGGPRPARPGRARCGDRAGGGLSREPAAGAGPAWIARGRAGAVVGAADAAVPAHRPWSV